MNQTTAAKLLPFGVHFGLDEATYHADPAIGSTDLKRLERGLEAYWWDSKHNPMHDPESSDTEDKLMGRAIHKAVLEGRAAFEAGFLRRPADEPGMKPSDKAAITKEWNLRASAQGKSLLKSHHYDRCAFAAAAIASNPHYANAFQGGEAEVSVFFMWNDVRCKARFDYLKPGAIGDLKSIVNERERVFSRACLYQMRDLRMPLQAKHYLNARSLLPKFVAAGAVYGDHDFAWLDAVAKKTPGSAWQWVFYQKTKAPLTFSRILSPANPRLLWEEDRIEAALSNYRTGVERFGLDKPWLDHDAPQEFSEEEMPPEYL